MPLKLIEQKEKQKKTKQNGGLLKREKEEIEKAGEKDSFFFCFI